MVARARHQVLHLVPLFLLALLGRPQELLAAPLLPQETDHLHIRLVLLIRLPLLLVGGVEHRLLFAVLPATLWLLFLRVTQVEAWTRQH